MNNLCNIFVSLTDLSSNGNVRISSSAEGKSHQARAIPTLGTG